MPIYEYRCNDCSSDFEYQQRMSDDPKTVCESCGGTLEKLISRSSFHFKGGGWYKDLYASPKKENSSSGEAAADTGSAKSADKAGDSQGSKTPAPAAPASTTSGTGTSSTSSSGASAAHG